MSINYGLTINDLANAKRKLKKQEDYLKSNNFVTDNGEEKSLLDVSYSANLSKRYYPRILNKVNTFVSNGIYNGLIPVFLTITLDGFFRDLLKGDYSRYKGQTKKEYIKHIPNNDRFGHYRDYLDKGNSLTPKDLYKILSFQLHRFNMSETLRNIKKDGFTYSFIRVTEPHKDGTPHFHILMYIPEQYLPNLFTEFKRFFPAPRNRAVLTSRKPNEFYTGMFETEGFQTEIRNPAGYLLKYLLKSFRNLIEDKELDFLQAWYVHNKIPRIITTHTLISQDVYHKIAPLEPDWYYLSNLRSEGVYEKDTINNKFTLFDLKGRKITFDNGLAMISFNGKVLSSYGSKKFTLKKVRLRSLDFSCNKWYQHLPDNAKPKGFNILDRFIFYVPPKPYSYYISKLFDDGTLFVLGSSDDFYISSFDNSLDDLALFDCSLSPDLFISVSKMSDFQLYNYYLNFDFDFFNPARYAIVNNELVDRGLLNEYYLNPNDFNTRFCDE